MQQSIAIIFSCFNYTLIFISFQGNSKKKVPPKDSTFSSIFGKFLVKPIAVVKRSHKQALKTVIFIVFSVFSELYKAIIQPTASLWGTG